jgi:hypothetical protein
MSFGAGPLLSGRSGPVFIDMARLVRARTGRVNRRCTVSLETLPYPEQSQRPTCNVNATRLWLYSPNVTVFGFDGVEKLVVPDCLMAS